MDALCAVRAGGDERGDGKTCGMGVKTVVRRRGMCYNDVVSDKKRKKAGMKARTGEVRKWKTRT